MKTKFAAVVLTALLAASPVFAAHNANSTTDSMGSSSMSQTQDNSSQKSKHKKHAHKKHHGRTHKKDSTSNSTGMSQQ